MRLSPVFLAWTVALFLKTAVAGGEVCTFDMGPEGSPVWPGFTLVTADTTYTPERGFGWDSRGQIEGYKNFQPDDLARDLVVVRQRDPLEFRLDLANGDYRVWVLSGDDMTAGGDFYRSFHLTEQVRVLAEGKEVFRRQRDYFGLQDADYVPGQSIWDKYIKGRYLEALFPVTVSDGQLNLTFEGLTGELKRYAFPICAIVVYPAAEAEAMDGLIAEIDEARKQAFLARWQKKEPNVETPPPEINDETRRLGYITFPRNYLKLVFPQTTPGPDESGDTLRTFAARGEWEPVSFCIRPIRDLKGVTVTVSDLCSGGARISAENVRVRVVKYQESTNRGSLNYLVIPYSLMAWKKIDIPAGLTKQYWLKLWVPENAKPGFYNGTVTIAAENAPSKTLQLELRVLPFRLARSNQARWFYFGNRRRIYQEIHDGKQDEGYWEIYKKESENLKEHGFCLPPRLDGVSVRVDREKKKLLAVDLSRLEEEIEFRRKIGAMPPDGFLCVLCGGFAKAYCGARWIQQTIPVVRKEVYFSDDPADVGLFIEIVQAIDKEIRKKGWGIPAFECGGELTNYAEMGLTYGMRAYGALKKAGVLTAMRGNGPVDYAIIEAGLIDYAIPNLALMRDEWTDTMKKKCKGLWLYNYSNGRYGFGFFAWKKSATRCLHEGYVCTGGRPWDDFDAGAYNWHVGVENTRDGVASRISFEHMAEGVDDFDYIHTCEQLLARVEKLDAAAAREAVAEARKTLKYIADRTFTDHDFRAYVPGAPYDFHGSREEASGLYRDAGCRWSADDFQKYRWLVAREIMRLEEVGR